MCLQGLGKIQQAKGQLDRARELYQESLAAARASGHPRLVNVILTGLGLLARDAGHYQQAHRYLKEALKIERRLGREHEMASTLHELGNVAYLNRRLKEARRYYDTVGKFLPGGNAEASAPKI